MGSRLKGKRSKAKSRRDDRSLFKVVLYSLIGLVLLAVLWYLWLSDRGLEITKEMKSSTPPGSPAGST